MKLEDLVKRRQEIEAALTQTTTQYHTLLGHKQEIDFQISELSKQMVNDETKIDESLATPEEVPVE